MPIRLENLRLLMLFSLFSWAFKLQSQIIQEHLLTGSIITDSSNILIIDANGTKEITSSKYKSSFYRVLDSISKFKPETNGRISIEGYKTTFQNPRIISESEYLRFSGNLGLKIGIIPISTDFYVTTENQNLYNSNYFRLRFNYKEFIKSISEDWKHQLELKKADMTKNKIDLKKNKNYTIEIQNKIKHLDVQKNKIGDEINKLKASQNAYSKRTLDSLNSLKNFNKIDSSYNFNKIKGLNSKVANPLDSFKLKRFLKDSALIFERITELQRTLDLLESKNSRIDSIYKADSIKVEYYKDLLSNPEKKAIGWLKTKKDSRKMQILSSIKDFQTGILNPNIHYLSLNGMTLKGLQSTVEMKNIALTLVGGKTLAIDPFNYNRQTKLFERNTIGLSATFNIRKNATLQFFGHYIQDPEDKFKEQNRAAIRNSVNGIEIKSIQSKWSPVVTFSSAYSHYQTLNPEILNTTNSFVSNFTNFTRLKATTAYKIELEKNLTKWFNLYLSKQQIGPKYKSFGNPFMRTNFIENQIKLKIELFKGQIRFGSFYKVFEDNILNTSETTNKTSGYGFSIQSQFKNRKLPNFTASISPYEQGNNHPDSLFRVNSQFSIVNGSINYQVGRTTKYFILIYGSQSNMKFSESMSAKIQTLSISQDLNIHQKVNLGISSTFVRSFPSIDSTQSNVHQMRLNLIQNKFYSIGFTGVYAHYLNGAYRKGLGANYTHKITNSVNLSLRCGFDSYYRLWGINHQESIWGLCRLEVRF